MIQLPTEKYMDFIEFLNSMQLTTEPCQLVILPAHLTIVSILNKNDDEDEGFACYGSESKLIYVAGNTKEMGKLIKKKTGEDVTEDDLYKYMLQNIAHEYFHHLQNVSSEEFSEEEAENFSNKVVDEFLNRTKE